MNGGVEVNLTPPDAPVVVTDTLTWNGMDVLTADRLRQLRMAVYMRNVHTTAHPSQNYVHRWLWLSRRWREPIYIG